MSTQSLQKTFQLAGVTPWQLILGVSCIGSWWATVQPLPEKLEKLNNTVQLLSTRVEVQSVLLDSVKELRVEVQLIREELALIKGRITALRGTAKPSELTGKLETTNELSPIRQ